MKTYIGGYDINLEDDPMGGICLAIYFIGCEHNCNGCHNPDFQDVKRCDNKVKISVRSLLKIIEKRIELIDSIVFSGGDPLYKNNKKFLSNLIKNIKLKYRERLRLILYTGYKYEDIDEEIINNLNIVIDGKYDKRVPNKQFIFPATLNQRVFIEGIEIIDLSKLPINKK